MDESRRSHIVGAMTGSATRLEEIERGFRILADAAPVMLWRSGPDKLCNFFNENWLRFTGRTMEQELGTGWTEGVHPDDYEQCLETYTVAFDARRPFRMQYRLRRHDGIYRWIDDTGKPHYAEDGSFVGYIGSCVDVHDFRESTDRLQEALAEKTALLAEKVTLLREVHHRVKNNLQLIVSLLAIRSGREPEPHTREVLQNISKKVLAMALVQEQLSNAPNLGSIDFGRYLHEQRLFFEGRSAALTVNAVGVQLSLEKATPLALITSELISNCYQHAFPENRPGRIEVTLELLNDRRARIVISDDGIGCLLQELESARGTGWKIVTALAEQADAVLRVESNQGTTITIEFSLADPEDEAPRE